MFLIKNILNADMSFCHILFEQFFVLPYQRP